MVQITVFKNKNMSDNISDPVIRLAFGTYFSNFKSILFISTSWCDTV